MLFLKLYSRSFVPFLSYLRGREKRGRREGEKRGRGSLSSANSSAFSLPKMYLWLGTQIIEKWKWPTSEFKVFISVCLFLNIILHLLLEFCKFKVSYLYFKYLTEGWKIYRYLKISMLLSQTSHVEDILCTLYEQPCMFLYSSFSLCLSYFFSSLSYSLSLILGENMVKRINILFVSHLLSFITILFIYSSNILNCESGYSYMLKCRKLF